MNIEKLEADIQSITADLSEKSFIYDLLLAYDQPKSSITRLQKGDYNLSKNQGEILWKKKLFFREETATDLHVLIDRLKGDLAIARHHPRFIIVTDYHTLLSVDTKTDDTLDIPIQELAKHFDFFLPWAGMEKSQIQGEKLADTKAAERMGRLYDLILGDNSVENEADRHILNIFLSRLLFCFFAEDTDIFKEGQFTNAIASHTSDDGSDLQAYLQKLFTVLNLRERSDYPKFLQAFPYVNGGLFADDHPVPAFSAKSRKIIIECGALNWKSINPDIFGSMMQAVVHTNQRSSLGMHYTSVVNIMKVIEPLFLNDLYEELEKAANNEKKLTRLLDRLYHLRVFDPACGSGNFLIITYKELCMLEIEIYKQLQQISDKWKTAKSGLRLNQFYGIELDDFAHETAKLSLWLAEHQMNLAFKEVFGDARATLPLRDSGYIVCGNAARLDWEKICPNDKNDEIFVLGNPPYLGQRNQKEEHKDDMDLVFKGLKNYKNLDYISIWFFKASKYAYNKNIKFSFVSTNSICQGTQVEMLWPYIFYMNLEIFFAYKNIKWSNNAKRNAGVTVSIIGIRTKSKDPKNLFDKNIKNIVVNINPYLLAGRNVIVKKRRSLISSLPKMEGGNQPREGGHLILTDEEKQELIDDYPEVSQFIRRLSGSNEFLYGIPRWCIWISSDKLKIAEKILPLKQKIKSIKELRTNGNTLERNFKDFPYRFVQINEPEETQIIIPVVSSERREYIPIDYLEKHTVVLNSANVIFDPEPYVFGVVSSRMHNLWVKAVAGKLENRIRYTTGVCYNSFPFPDISEQSKKEIADHVFRIMDEREQHSEKAMAELYDPDKMPEGLRMAHHEMDLAVEQCYRARPFKTDEERLEYLFKLYEEMTAAESKQGK